MLPSRVFLESFMGSLMAYSYTVQGFRVKGKNGRFVFRTEHAEGSRHDQLKNSKHGEISGVGSEQTPDAVGVKDGGEVSIQNAFAAQTKLAHPA